MVAIAGREVNEKLPESQQKFCLSTESYHMGNFLWVLRETRGCRDGSNLGTPIPILFNFAKRASSSRVSNFSLRCHMRPKGKDVPQMTQDEIRAEHNRLYREASAAVYPLIVIHGKPISRLQPGQELELRRGIALFERVLRINPANWNAMWLVGKAYQQLRDFESALSWFSRAHETNPSHPDVSREAAIAAMELGRPVDAIPFCERAIEAKPGDPGLRANLALATLFSGDAKRAELLANDALKRDPTDRITSRLAKICREVLAGKRGCPHHTRDIF